MKKLYFTCAFFALTSTVSVFAEPIPAPDLAVLNTSGYIMGPGNTTYPVHNAWKKMTAFMKSTKVLDKVVERIESVVCGSNQNRSVLLIGEPSTIYQYVFARMATRGTPKCADLWHIQMDISKIEAGHKYVGEVDEYWQRYVLKPVDGKGGILYFDSLGALIGLGSHANDDTGIEREYASNITQGRMRSVAFMDRNEYNLTLGSKNAYVVESFAERIVLPSLAPEQVGELLSLYLSTMYTGFKLGEDELKYLLKSSAYYQPNRPEPDRSMALLNLMVRNAIEVSPNPSNYEFTKEDVRAAILSIAQVPQWMLNKDYSIIKNLRANLDSDVVGVVDGKAAIVRLAKNGYVAGRTDDKPIATILLTGPTGTGKSYLPKKFAEFMGLRLITIDMTGYKEASSLPLFIETMSRHLANNPYAVYLFEEIDKATLSVLDQLYFMMDEGVFYDKFQRPLFARGAFMVFTSNAAADVILKNKDHPDLKKMVHAELMKVFRDSFLNRFDAISPFMPFSDAEFKQLAGIMIKKKIEAIRQIYNWNLSVDTNTLDYVAVNGKSLTLGARPMERLLDAVIGGGIAEYQINKSAIPDGSQVSIRKTTEPNWFSIRVASESEMPYLVDKDFNSRSLPGFMKDFLKSIEVFGAHD